MINEQSNFQIESFFGALPIKFGMQSDEVENLIGPADEIQKNFQGRVVEHRSYMNVAYSNEAFSGVDHVGFGRQMTNVFFGEINIFSGARTDVLYKLCERSEGPLIYMGFVYFLDLGIYLSGFHDEDESQVSIAAFRRGGYDEKKYEMKSFSISDWIEK